MKINDTNKKKALLRDKFVNTASLGDVIKVYYPASCFYRYYLVVKNGAKLRLLNLETSELVYWFGETLGELYDNAFVSNDDVEIIDSLDVYGKSELTIK